MPLILGTNSIKDTGYTVANSVRFGGADHDLRIEPASVSNRRTFTISFWTKRSSLGGNGSGLIAGWGDGYDNGSASMIYFNDSDELEIDHDVPGADYNFHSDMVFRDTSAWYHIVIAIDTTDGTEADRQKIYVNGAQITLTETALGFPPEDFDTYFNNLLTAVGSSAYQGGSGAVPEYSGYFSEFVMIDGSALAPTSFGEFNEDSPNIWQPIDVSGLTFGTNGFYLDFEDSANLGNDANGGTDLTETNLAATDQATDTPTNNFCTLNPLDAYYEASTFSEGNLKIVTESSGYSYNTSTIGLTSGKWYCEVYIEATPHSGTKDSAIGIAGRMSEADLGWLGLYSDSYAIYGGNGQIYTDAGTASYGVTHTTGDIIGIYLDLDNNKLYFAKNGVIMNSGTGKAIVAASATKAGAYFMVAADYYNGASGTYRVNFGNPIYSLSSAVADANGYGSFEYDPSDGGGSSFDSAAKDFLAICTKNLAEYG